MAKTSKNSKNSDSRELLEALTILEKEKNISMLFICHDLALIRSFAHQIAVMYLGNIVEVIPGEDVTEHAVHPSIYTGTSGCTVLHSYGSQPEDPKYRE